MISISFCVMNHAIFIVKIEKVFICNRIKCRLYAFKSRGADGSWRQPEVAVGVVWRLEVEVVLIELARPLSENKQERRVHLKAHAHVDAAQKNVRDHRTLALRGAALTFE